MATPDTLTELPKVVSVPDQPCQQLYEANPVLLGFDVVYYHQIPSFKNGGVSKQGSPEHAYNFQGYQFWFISDLNRKLFMSDPWKYAPAWGGFCSYGIALETKPEWPWENNFLGPPASPWQGWAIVDGVLTFNIWAEYTDRFLSNKDENMKLAAQRWREMFNGELRAGPFNTHCIGHGTLKNWCLTQQPSPWLEDLPECNNATLGADANIVGGGIVSSSDSFRDFNAATNLSPFQKKWIVAGVIMSAVTCLALAGLLYHCRSKSKIELAKLPVNKADRDEEVPAPCTADNVKSEEEGLPSGETVKSPSEEDHPSAGSDEQCW